MISSHWFSIVLPRLLICCLWGLLLVNPGFSRAGDPVSDTTVIHADQIQSFHVNTIYDLLNQLPGIKAGSSSISIRGSYKVLVFMDQVPLNDPAASHGGIKWDAVDLNQVEKITILRGKGGVEYGDNASGGIVDIALKKIRSRRIQAEARAGNHQAHAFRLSGQERRDTLGVGITAAYSRTQGFKINNDKTKKRLETRTDWKWSSGFSLQSTLLYLHQDRGNSGRPEYPTPHSRSEDELISATVLTRVGGIKSKTHVSRAVKQSMDPDRNIDDTLTVVTVNQTLSGRPHWTLTGPVNLGCGVEYAVPDNAAYETASEYNTHVFAAKSFVWKGVSLELGLRDIYYSEYGNRLNPEVSLGYKTGMFSARLSANQTSNAPTFSKKYRKSSSTLPNPDLTLERSQNLGFTLSVEPSAGVSISLAPFYNRITDRITYVRGSGGTGQYENFGKVTYQGADLSLGLDVIPQLDVKLSYTYLRAMDEDTGLWLSAKPRHRGVVDLTWAPISDLTLGLNLNAVSPMYTRSDNTTRVPGYAIWDFRGEYRLKFAVIFCEIDNLFDTYHILGDGYQGTDFTWTLGVRYAL